MVVGFDLLSGRLESFFGFILDTRVLIFLMVWEGIWKGVALWKCGRNSQVVWFIAIFVLNTLGILPIIYLLFFSKNRRDVYDRRGRKIGKDD